MTDHDARRPPRATAAALARDVAVTSWYIAASIVFFLVATLGIWGLWAMFARTRLDDPPVIVGYLGGTVAVVAGSVALLARYRRDGDVGDADRVPRVRRFVSWPVIAGAVGSAAIGVSAASVLIAGSLLATVLCLVRWGPGIRWRGIVLVELALVVLWFAERGRFEARLEGVGSLSFTMLVFAVTLPAMIALSLWSWDVVLELNRARATEARLAATQERLRLAGELHDLQGHHLQVIALQLELAERMLPRDPDAAAEQVRLARASVDAARAGTRELAGRFRGVPLPDELANAADLLRAAGLRVGLDVAADAELAPADILGPVVREATTNVLKHGGGRWAELSLARRDGFWRLTAANDPGAASALGAGSGLESIAHRIGAVGGDVRTQHDAARFAVVVEVPAAVADGGEIVASGGHRARMTAPGDDVAADGAAAGGEGQGMPR